MKITTFPYALGWLGRSQRFEVFNTLYAKNDAVYSIFSYVEKKVFEPTSAMQNTKEEKLFVYKGALKDLLHALSIYRYDKNELKEARDVLKLKLIQTHFEDGFFRHQPKKIVIEGVFYSLTEEEFEHIPFERYPITSKRDGLFRKQLTDSVVFSEELKKHFTKTLQPLRTTKEKSAIMTYIPLVVEEVKEYVPKVTNSKALELAIKHDLTVLEFSFLNYFYETSKALRNDKGQTFFDMNSKGIGWQYDRKWVKRKMQRLIDLGLVKHEIRYDCRDPRYTSWYFYDAEKDLDKLTHEF